MTDTSTFSETLRGYLAAALPDLPVLLHIGTGKVDTAAPYVVLTVTAEQELVRGNHTWELGLVLELHAKAYETEGGEQQDLFRSLCSVIQTPALVDDLNRQAADFYLYALSLQGADEPLVQDNSFIQSARCRAVIQF